MQTKMESCSCHREEINSIKKAKLFIFLLSTQGEVKLSEWVGRGCVGTSYNFERAKENCFLICIIFARGTFHYFSCFSCTRREREREKITDYCCKYDMGKIKSEDEKNGEISEMRWTTHNNAGGLMGVVGKNGFVREIWEFWFKLLIGFFLFLNFIFLKLKFKSFASVRKLIK